MGRKPVNGEEEGAWESIGGRTMGIVKKGKMGRIVMKG